MEVEAFDCAFAALLDVVTARDLGAGEACNPPADEEAAEVPAAVFVGCAAAAEVEGVGDSGRCGVAEAVEVGGEGEGGTDLLP